MKYAIELRPAPSQGGWQWEVWLADSFVMCAQGWMRTKKQAVAVAVCVRRKMELS